VATRLEQRHAVTILLYAGAAALVASALWQTGAATRELSSLEVALLILVAVTAGFLGIVSLMSLACYFIFIPSLARDGHLFTRVHAVQMIHPLTTSVLLGSVALCIATGSTIAWIILAGLMIIYTIQTALMVRQIRAEDLLSGFDGAAKGTFFLLLHLILGTEIVTVAAGAKPLAPWQLSTLPEDTWIVDVRTKPEFYWNRLNGAQSFPWGAGIIEAAKDRPKDRPALVTCFSGHRSPTVAVILRKLGFTHVYNLNWGILYLVLLMRGKKGEGPFSLTRPHRDPHRRGEDVRSISMGYIALECLILILAPLEQNLMQVRVSVPQQIVGAALLIMGLGIVLASFVALGRNFRVFAAPRRSGTLITRGIYTKVRHPMYTGAVVLFAGYILLWGSLWSVPLWLAFAVLYMVKAVKEEAILAERFPQYREYRSRTWKFVPYLW
jgi:protein-S-isoprenylcysteine O-methyltransferase Ste14/rhodanese-related sulfurtransferase